MFSKYIINLKQEYIKESGTAITYTSFLDKWKDENRKFALYIGDDNVYSMMGCKIIDILSHSDIVKNVLMRSSSKEHRFHVLEINDKHLMSQKTRHSVVNLPLKLPMICPPKPYGHNF